MPFADRTDAGRKLVAALAPYRGTPAVVLALPRGGVPVAKEVAAALDAPLDLVIVRKIGVPMQPELAMGAVVDGPDPLTVRNEDVVKLAGVSAAEFDAVRDAERKRRSSGDEHSTLATAPIPTLPGASQSSWTTAWRRAPRRAPRSARRGGGDRGSSSWRCPSRRRARSPSCAAKPTTSSASKTMRRSRRSGSSDDDFGQVSDSQVQAILAEFPSAPRSVARGSELS